MVGEFVKIVVFVPTTDAGRVRFALAKAGAGKIGKYSQTSFSVRGVGRFKPLKGARPNIGKINQIEKVIEERIESICKINDVKEVVSAVKKVHPYEEPIIEISQLMKYD